MLHGGRGEVLDEISSLAPLARLEQKTTFHPGRHFSPSSSHVPQILSSPRLQTAHVSQLFLVASQSDNDEGQFITICSIGCRHSPTWRRQVARPIAPIDPPGVGRLIKGRPGQPRVSR